MRFQPFPAPLFHTLSAFTSFRLSRDDCFSAYSAFTAISLIPRLPFSVFRDDSFLAFAAFQLFRASVFGLFRVYRFLGFFRGIQCFLNLFVDLLLRKGDAL